MKKFYFLALMMLMALSAKASEPEVYSVYDGDTTLTYYYDDRRSSYVGNEIAELYVSDQPHFEGYCEKIKRAVIDPSMKNANLQSISGMFYGWSNNTLTALKTIDGMANLVTDQVTDMQYVFCGCASLDSIDLSHFNTANVTNMQGLFASCSALKKLDMSTFDTGKVQYMRFMFRGCKSLEELDLSNFNTEAVIQMHLMFYECKSLRSINLSSFNTANVEDMNAMFEYCTALDTLDLSNFDTRKVTNMNTMFAYCSSLKSLDISQFGPAESCDLGWMFFNCSALNSIYCYQDWRTINFQNDQAMFYGCTAIIGGRDTRYNSSWTRSGLAHVDGGSEDPGYFTTYELEEERIPTGIENVQGGNVQGTKVIENGVLYIMYKGTMYNVQGQKVR